mmetsp:Transcript_12458/g.26986  ORF Transcript_12458/g.26986 Transcript_12458/m.26986 type:complete len:93 (+) Transcript_12458:1141-1419(+)
MPHGHPEVVGRERHGKFEEDGFRQDVKIDVETNVVAQAKRASGTHRSRKQNAQKGSRRLKKVCLACTRTSESDVRAVRDCAIEHPKTPASLK